uniref:Uncharacterized protein n=1 Tax=Peromyscus maniculatus bairdii TaxID=230844 RepID=A0A8C8W7M4_PERMB
LGEVLHLMLTTLETGTVPFSNPQKSPSEHTHLHEQTVARLSGFKATKLPTPGEFRWTIYQLAALILKQTQENNGSFALKMSRFLLVSCGGDSLGGCLPLSALQEGSCCRGRGSSNIGPG